MVLPFIESAAEIAMINDDNSTTDLAVQYIGNYRLLRLLGQGGFSSVYLGEQHYLKRLAAIKILRTVFNDQDKEYFLEEARLLANLSHPNIVRVHEFAVAQRINVSGSQNFTEYIPYLVMDFAANGSLRSIYPAGSCLFVDVAISYIKQLADALQYAHDHGIIHRDVKPENCLLNGQQQIMLSDFGLALFAPTPDLLTTQQMEGTLPYTAPEQLRGRPDFASDQYSLAVIAYEWLCGQRPFVGEDVEIITQHIYSRPPLLRSKNPAISQEIEDVILKALEKDPRSRYPSVQAFAHALEYANQADKNASLLHHKSEHAINDTEPFLHSLEAERFDKNKQESSHSTGPVVHTHPVEKEHSLWLNTTRIMSHSWPKQQINRVYLISASMMIFALIVSSFIGANYIRTKVTTASIDNSWHFIWGDDFNGSDHSGVDRRNWIYDIGSGYPGGTHNWGTNETDTMSDSLANVSQDGHGHLLIRPTLNSHSGWISGRIETVRSDFAAPVRGEIAVQASIRMPAVTGVGSLGYWSTLWMLGTPFRGKYTNWPGVGQINVVEHVNGFNDVRGTLHCGVFPEGPCNEPVGIVGKRTCALTTCTAGFHTYRVEYDRRTSPEQIRWYLDGVQYWQVSSNYSGMDATTWNEALHHNFFLVLDVAIGGYLPSVNGGGPTSATVAGAPMVVDYIHVYKMN